MTEELVIGILTQAFYVSLIVLLPILGIALIVGILISVFQAATSIQEMTLTFIPKLLVTAVAIVFLMPWIFEKLITFTYRIIDIINSIV
jgi:flagellar biosynthetic protein FliQ